MIYFDEDDDVECMTVVLNNMQEVIVSSNILVDKDTKERHVSLSMQQEFPDGMRNVNIIFQDIEQINKLSLMLKVLFDEKLKIDSSGVFH